MKKILFGVLGLLALVSACNDDHEDANAPTQVDARSLVTPSINIRVADQFTQKAFTGILEVYPCNQNQTTYFGNYVRVLYHRERTRFRKQQSQYQFTYQYL